MEKAVTYTKNVAILSIAGLVIFFAIGAILVILNALTWSILGDWMTKALTVAGIFFAANVVIGLLLAFVAKSKK